MKYITTYREASLRSPKIFESSESMEEIKQYLKDIFQELVDIGFECDVVAENRSKIIVSIYTLIGKESEFDYKDVVDYVMSSNDYMISIGFEDITQFPVDRDGLIASFQKKLTIIEITYKKMYKSYFSD